MADFDFTPFSSDTFTLPTVTAPTKLTDFSSPSEMASNINNAINTYFGTRLNIEQQKAALRVAKAQGNNAVATANSGLPSPTLLALAGAGILTLLLLKK